MALRRRRYFDVPFMTGSTEHLVRDWLWFGTAYSAPSYMVGAQLWAITRLLRGLDGMKVQDVLAREAARVARSNPRTADFTNNGLQRALKEIIAVFPVYRTYVDGAAAPGYASASASYARR